MRDTLRDWKREWIKTNGLTTDLEVVIKDGSVDESEQYLYEGSFAEIPENLLDKMVTETARIIASSIPEREGAYSLSI